MNGSTTTGSTGGGPEGFAGRRFAGRRFAVVLVGLGRQALFALPAVAAAAAYLFLERPPNQGETLLRLVAFLILASLPAWLYIRFVAVKAGPLRDE